MKNKLLNILFWSVISAAFIGPGTITTASKSGALFGFDLLWALVFSTFACLILQEAVARLAIHSGTNLGEAISSYFREGSSRLIILVLIVGAIILGSAAYEAGNILGAVAGFGFITDLSVWITVPFIGVIAVIALTQPSVKSIAHFLGIIVAVMGVSFFTTAIKLKPSISGILKGSIIPSFPESAGSGLLILGLIGTTVVPYNLFLGSGIAKKDQSIREMRFGLSIAIIFGGLISMSVLIVGSFVTGDFSYEALITTLRSKLGLWSGMMFGIGMLAAGLSSAITAPFASAITARGLFGTRNPEKWNAGSMNFRIVWGSVLLTGIIFGISGLKPVPVIIIAQALNGLILPFITIFLLIVVNDPEIIGSGNLNGKISNTLMLIVVWVTLVLGMTNLAKAVSGTFPGLDLTGKNFTPVYLILSFMIGIYVLVLVMRNRGKKFEKNEI